MKLFAGTSNQPLVQNIADHLKIKLSKAEVIRFDDSEVRVRIGESVKNETCVVVQSTSNPTDTNFMELIFFCDALRRQEARKVIAVIPYFGYARQSIQHTEGECVSVNVVIKILESIGFDKIYTVDLHDRATEGVFSVPFKHLTAVELLAVRMKNILKSNNGGKLDPTHIAVVSPDQGAIHSARLFGEDFFQTSDFNLAVIEKRRSYKAVHQSVSLGLYGDVENKIAIIVDDMVTSAGTLVHAAELCKERGAKKVYAVVTHPDFSKNAFGRIDSSSIEKLIVTDTIQQNQKQSSSRIEYITTAKLIADELTHVD